jgi:crotonobetainyl-CoA:carnitine CoA-transferase CaiB-like acyl-CoA transferase
MGPFATQILAELGADVIKVEPHEGDNMRDVGPMRNRAMGHLYLNLNRGKRCLVLDLKKPEGRAAHAAAVPKTDVLVYNCGPRRWRGWVCPTTRSEPPTRRSFTSALTAIHSAAPTPPRRVR